MPRDLLRYMWQMCPSGCGEECVGEKEGYLCPREQTIIEGTSYRFRQQGHLVAL